MTTDQWNVVIPQLVILLLGVGAGIRFLIQRHDARVDKKQERTLRIDAESTARETVATLQAEIRQHEVRSAALEAENDALRAALTASLLREAAAKEST